MKALNNLINSERLANLLSMYMYCSIIVHIFVQSEIVFEL
jgi:hypothetical protein